MVLRVLKSQVIWLQEQSDIHVLGSTQKHPQIGYCVGVSSLSAGSIQNVDNWRKRYNKQIYTRKIKNREHLLKNPCGCSAFGENRAKSVEISIEHSWWGQVKFVTICSKASSICKMMTQTSFCCMVFLGVILGYDSPRTTNQKASTQPKAFAEFVERDGTPAKHYGAKCEFSHARQVAATTVRVVPGRTFSSSRVLSSFLDNKGRHAKGWYTLSDKNTQQPHHVGNKASYFFFIFSR